MVLPRSRAGSPVAADADRRAGYVLIELLAALAVSGLIMFLALPGVPQGTTMAKLHALLSSTAALLREARTEAIVNGAVKRVTFDSRRRTFRAGGRLVVLPEDVDVALGAGDSCGASRGGVAEIVFRANGTSCGAVLRFAKGGRVFRIRVNWVTGHVEIAAGS
jgi:general secretion pathway protein H